MGIISRLAVAFFLFCLLSIIAACNGSGVGGGDDDAEFAGDDSTLNDDTGDDDTSDDDQGDDDDSGDDDNSDDDSVDDDSSDDDATDDDDDDTSPTPNYALSFDGTSNYVILGNGNWLNNSSYTLEAWIKPLASSQPAHIVSSTEDNPWEYDFMLALDSGTTSGIAMGGHWDGACNWLRGTTNLYLDVQWHHVAFCFDNPTKTGTIFVDGVKEGEKLFDTGPGQGGDQIVAVGIDAAQAMYYFKGIADEIRISDAVRYDAATFDPERLFELDLHTVGLWHFDEGTGGTTADATGNQDDATIIGATWVLVE